MLARSSAPPAPATRSPAKNGRRDPVVPNAGLPDAQLNTNRKRRLLRQLDKALGRRPQPAAATPAQKERRERAVSSHRDARRSYDELKRAILAHGGIRANADYK